MARCQNLWLVAANAIIACGALQQTHAGVEAQPPAVADTQQWTAAQPESVAQQWNYGVVNDHMISDSALQEQAAAVASLPLAQGAQQPEALALMQQQELQWQQDQQQQQQMQQQQFQQEQLQQDQLHQQQLQQEQLQPELQQQLQQLQQQQRQQQQQQSYGDAAYYNSAYGAAPGVTYPQPDSGAYYAPGYTQQSLTYQQAATPPSHPALYPGYLPYPQDLSLLNHGATTATTTTTLIIAGWISNVNSSAWDWENYFQTLISGGSTDKTKPMDALRSTTYPSATMVVSTCIWFGLVGLVAFVYWDHKAHPPVPKPGVQPAQLVDGAWAYGLFDCLAEPRICCLTCCCSGIRWADNMRQANFAAFWPALIFYTFLQSAANVSSYLGGLWIVWLFTVVYMRMRIKMRFNIGIGCTGCITDTLSYMCCTVCAITQEARQLELAWQVDPQRAAMAENDRGFP